MHRDGLTRCAAVIAMIRRCPGTGDRVILRTTPSRGRIAEGQTRTGIARIAGRRRGEARASRALDRARPRQRTDLRRFGVMHRDRLARCAAVIAMIRRGPGSGD